MGSLLAVGAPSATPKAVSAQAADEYTELKHLISERRLLDRSPGGYLIHGVTAAALMAVIVVGIQLTHTSWSVLLWTVPAAWLCGQLGFLAHDSAHGQVFDGKSKNYVMSLFIFNFLLGGSRGWWADKHNLHHGHPNIIGTDPDIDFSIMAFTADQARAATPLRQRVMRHQAKALWPLLTMQAISMHVHSVRFMLNHRRLRNASLEVGLMLAHYVIYLGGLMLWLGPGRGLIFAAIHQSLLGIYAGAAFLPNHIGMPILRPAEEKNFLRRQVLTARNLSANRVTDYVFGGLSCQIEHHLFPTMSRSNLRKAAPIVRAFCEEREIPYYETGALRAYVEIYRAMAAAAAPLRRRASA